MNLIIRPYLAPLVLCHRATASTLQKLRLPWTVGDVNPINAPMHLTYAYLFEKASVDECSSPV